VDDITLRREAEKALRKREESFARPKRWKQSADWRAASPMTSIIC
jgi:hypothetical protein